MCFPPEISVPALPTAFVRVRDWRADERGSKRKQWRPSYVLPEEGVEIVSPSDAAPPAAPAHDVRSCGGWGAQTGGNHVDAAELCAAGIKLPLQQGSVAATNEEQHGLATWQGQQTFLDAAGAANMKKEGAVVSGVEESAGSPTRQHTQLEIPLPNLDSKPVVPEYADLEKLQDPAELFLEEGQQQGLSGPLQQQQQPLLVSGTPELESTGSFSAWFDCIAKNNDGEMEEATSLIKERSVTNASFETDTKPLKKKAPKLTKAEKNRKSAAAVHSHEGTEVDMCTEDDDAEPLLIDEKRKRRMLSNRASAQRSRQRRQDRLDQLEVLTAQLRVENASLLRKSNLALQLARKFEHENKSLLEKTQNLTMELLGTRKGLPATTKLHEECQSSPHMCADISEIVGEADPSPEVKSNLEKVPEDQKKLLKSTVSESFTTVNDQIYMENTSEGTHTAVHCNNKTAESCETVQVSEVGSAARKVKMTSVSSPVSCKTECENAQVFLVPTSLPQANMLNPVKESPLMIPVMDSQYLLEEFLEMFESDTANDPSDNNDIVMDQNWLESFAECLNA